MKFSRLKQFASIKGWRIEKNMAYGEENGYLFTLIDVQGFKIFASPLPSIGENTQIEILEYLNENKKALKISESLFDNAVLIIKFKEAFKNTKVETMNNLLKELTGFLNDKGIKGKGACIFCDNIYNNADQIIYIDSIMYSSHYQCYEHELAAIEEASREYAIENKNYFRGFIGALIGGLVSSIPWIFVQVYLNTIFPVLPLLIGIGSLKAYYIFKGLFGSGTRWIVALCTLVSIVLAQFGVLALGIIKNNTSLHYYRFVQMLSIPEIAHSFVSTIVIGILVSFFGLLGSFLQLKGDAKNVMPTIKKE